MKKIVLYILTIIAINYCFNMVALAYDFVVPQARSEAKSPFSSVVPAKAGTYSAYAKNIVIPAQQAHIAVSPEKFLLAEDREYEPPLIPKPNTLPGPTKEQQEKSNENTGSNAGIRTLITNILLPKATVTLIGFVGITSFLMLVVGGVRFVVSYGNEEAVGKAKNEIIYSIVGLVIALLAYTIVTIISNLQFVPQNEMKNTNGQTTSSPYTNYV